MVDTDQTTKSGPPTVSESVDSTSKLTLAAASPNAPAAGKMVDPVASSPQTTDAEGNQNLQQPGPPAANYAGFWIRLLAIIIDGIILSLVGGIVNAVFGGMGTALVNTTPATARAGTFAGLFGAAYFITLAINVAYYVGLTGTYGATLGKMALGLRVVGEKGQKIGLGKAALREIVGKFVSGVALCLGYLWVAFDEKKQGWHDKIASTYVVKTR